METEQSENSGSQDSEMKEDTESKEEKKVCSPSGRESSLGFQFLLLHGIGEVRKVARHLTSQFIELSYVQLSVI